MSWTKHIVVARVPYMDKIFMLKTFRVLIFLFNFCESGYPQKLVSHKNWISQILTSQTWRHGLRAWEEVHAWMSCSTGHTGGSSCSTTTVVQMLLCLRQNRWTVTKNMLYWIVLTVYSLEESRPLRSGRPSIGCQHCNSTIFTWLFTSSRVAISHHSDHSF